jgi:hypothetical protein
MFQQAIEEIPLACLTLTNCQSLLYSSLELQAVIPFVGAILVDHLGLHLTPNGSAGELVSQLCQAFGPLTFSRERDESGLYQWVTTLTQHNVQLWVVANENIDHSGTIVDIGGVL